MWFLTAVYFLPWFLIIWLGLCLYARILLQLGKGGYIAKYLVSYIVFILFVFFLASPLLIFSFVESWRLEVNTNKFYAFYFVFCLLLTWVPGLLYFEKHYLNDLKRLGYFAERR